MGAMASNPYAHGGNRHDEEYEHAGNHRHAHPAVPGALGGGWDREVAGSASQLQDGVAHQDERAFTATGWAGSQPPPPEPPAYTGAVGRSGIVDAYRPGFDGDRQVAPRYGGVGQDLATAERTFRRHRQDQSRIRSREYCQMPELR